jgi:hypothetical protein
MQVRLYLRLFTSTHQFCDGAAPCPDIEGAHIRRGRACQIRRNPQHSSRARCVTPILQVGSPTIPPKGPALLYHTNYFFENTISHTRHSSSSPLVLPAEGGSSAIISECESLEGAEDVRDMDVHCLSRMVLQSLRFDEFSSIEESVEAPSTFGSSAAVSPTTGTPTAHDR